MAEGGEDWGAAYGFVPSKRAAGLVFFSGVVGMDAEGSVPSDPQAQFRLAFGALDDALRAEGLTKDRLVDLVSFHADYPDTVEIFAKAKSEYLDGVLTCWTAIGAKLGTPEMLVEIRAVAEA